MLISARNKLKIKICCVEEGAVNSVVKGKLGSGSLSAVITKEACKDLGLEANEECFFVFKASNVLVAKPGAEFSKLSARNQLRGNVERLEDGAINTEVSVKLESGDTLCAIITKCSSSKLDLKLGDEVTMIIKASEIMVGK